MAYDSFHVQGPAVIECQITANQSSWSSLGLTVAEISIDPEILTEDVPADISGLMPNEVMYGGTICHIRFQLARWDSDVLGVILSGLRGGTEGYVPSSCIGTLYGVSGNFFGLRMTGSQRCGLNAERPWTFPAVMLTGSLPISIGTKVSRQQLSFRALPAAGVVWHRN